MSLSQTLVLERAERLATALTGRTRVERNVLLSVVADFMSAREPDRDVLRQTMTLLARGSGGHLERAGSYADQIRVVAEEVGRFLDDEPLAAGDCKSVFGWTARLLLVRGEPVPPRGGGPAAGGRGPGRGQGEPAPASAPRAPQPALGGIGGKGRSVLERFKQDLEEREKNGDK